MIRRMLARIRPRPTETQSERLHRLVLEARRLRRAYRSGQIGFDDYCRGLETLVNPHRFIHFSFTD